MEMSNERYNMNASIEKNKYVVFIPCYNAANTIKETLQSVKNAISNTSLDIPVYVYDDCSSDNSLEVAKEAWGQQGNLQLIRNAQNAGERKTTNNAFASFGNRFNWVFIIHADDIVKEDWLVTLIDGIEKYGDEKCFTIWSSFDSFTTNTAQPDKGDNSGTIQQAKRDNSQIKGYLTKLYSSWHISGAAFNLAIYRQLKGFDETLAQFGDTDFFVRGLLAGYSDVYIARTLTYYRIVAGSVSSVSVNTNRDIREIHLLIAKYKHILTKKEISSLYGTIRKLSARRMMKSLRKKNFAQAFLNFKQLSAAILK
jgi:glycosyltransferase involved in cell wall biosynthesis